MMLGVFEEYLVVLTNEFRLIFQVILWPVIVVGVIGNIAVLCRICCVTGGKTSFKPFYRSSLFSMAMSDLLLLSTSGTNILSMIGNRTLLWKLTDLSCTVIPYLQTVAVLIASMNLSGIALDRYAAIKSKYPLSKGPSWATTILLIVIIWVIGAGAAYPVLSVYTAHTLPVINNSTDYTGTLCLSDRNAAMTIYTALFALIFIPLGAIFITIYWFLALSISNRKQPGDSHHIGNNQSAMSQDNSTASTSIGTYKNVSLKTNGTTSTHIIRKRRTVRVILILIIIFTICRLPQWLFLIVKLHITTNDNFWWYLQVILTSLSLLNAAMHPFLYAFLNEALSLVKWMESLCCIWKRSLPIENLESNNVKEGSYTASAIVPRGPYSP